MRKLLLHLLLTLTLSGCAVYHRPQEQHGYYPRAVFHYHRVHGQTLRHPQCFRQR